LFCLGFGLAQTDDTISEVIEIKTIVCYEYPNVEEFARSIESYKEGFKKNNRFEFLKSLDTLFVYLDKKDSFKMKTSSRYVKVFKLNDSVSEYKLKYNNFSLLKLTYKRYYDFDSMEIDSVNQIFKKKERFLVERKKEILSYSFIKEIENQNSEFIKFMLFDILKDKKAVYVIDENEIENKKIALRPIDLRRLISDFYHQAF